MAVSFPRYLGTPDNKFTVFDVLITSQNLVLTGYADIQNPMG